MKKGFVPFWTRSGFAAPFGYWNSVGRSGGMYWSLYPEVVSTQSCLNNKQRNHRKVRNLMARESRRKNR